MRTSPLPARFAQPRFSKPIDVNVKVTWAGCRDLALGLTGAMVDIGAWTSLPSHKPERADCGGPAATPSGPGAGEEAEERRRRERVGHLIVGAGLGYPVEDLAGERRCVSLRTLRFFTNCHQPSLASCVAALHAALFSHTLSPQPAQFAEDLLAAVAALQQHHLVHLACSPRCSSGSAK